MALTDQIISYWKFDEASGNAADSAGSNTLTNENVSFATGKINNGADFERGDGADIFRITNGSQTGLNFSASDAFTLNMWVNLESLPTSGQIYVLVDKESVAGTEGYKFFYQNNGGTLRFAVDINDGGAHTYAINHTLSTSTLYMVTLTWSGASTTMEIYVNGSSIGTVSTVATISDATADFRVGWDDSAGRVFDGIIDELGVWSRALGSSEVTALYNSSNGLSYPFSTVYTLTATTGAFTLTGVAATLTSQRKLTASAGAYTFTGIDATLTRPINYTFSTDTGIFSLVGNNLRGILTSNSTQFTSQAKSSTSWTAQSKN
jgi:hypothetical protein